MARVIQGGAEMHYKYMGGWGRSTGTFREQHQRKGEQQFDREELTVTLRTLEHMRYVQHKTS